MTDKLKPSFAFGVDWATITPEVAAKVPLVVADSGGGLHLVKDRKENTPMHLAAAYSKNPEVITALMEANAEGINNLLIRARTTSMYIDIKNTKGETPLMMAVQYDNADVAEALTDNSFNGNSYRDYDEAGRTGTSIFWVAANARSSEMAETIATYVEPDILYDFAEEFSPLTDEDGHTPLQCAVLAENAAAISGFIEAWGYEDKTVGGTILHFAVTESENYDRIGSVSHTAVKLLIDAGVEVNCLNKSGRTALDYVSDDDWRMAEELRKAGGYVCDEDAGDCFGVNWKTATLADIAEIDNDARGGLLGHTSGGYPIFCKPIDWAVRFCPNPEVIEELITTGDGVKRLTIMAAAENPHPEIIKAFIAGEDVNERENDWEYTLLHRAVRAGHTEVAACLIQAGADVNSVYRYDAGGEEDEYETPLDTATRAHGSDSDIAKMLIAAGAVCGDDLPDEESHD